jgi:hypothetical protein
VIVAIEELCTSRRARCAVLLAAFVATIVAVFSSWLPLGPDIYQHLVWDWQVMRCLAQWQPPLWLPDLNAGFGSPGIRLYSPLGPMFSGSLGLVLGDAGRGLRLAAILAALGVLWTAGRRTAPRSMLVGAAALISPMVLFSIFGRAAWSEFLSIPLMLWLLLGMAKGELDGAWDGGVLALLWLTHAPTTIMVGLVGVGSLALHRSRDYTVSVLKAAAVACGLTAWHWLPLLRETADIEATEVMTGGMYESARNFLASETAHTPQVNAWLGWVAIALLASVLISRLWVRHPHRSMLGVVCILLASPLALPLWRIPGPHQLLQFPWRWLLPGTLLVVTAIAETPGRRIVGMATILAPALFMPWAPWVQVPNLDTSLTWNEAGKVLLNSIGGNPFLVDVRQHRPPAFTDLERNVRLFGPTQRVLIIGDGEVLEIRRWSPLRYELRVRGGQPFVVAFRILDYPYWSVTSDGETAAETELAPGVVACRVPSGNHVLRVRWVGNPLAAVGQIVALLTVLLLVLWHRRRIGLEA